ncbi:MAG: OmpP1/FadL family transporter [Gemmatimonadota bacterium]
MGRALRPLGLAILAAAFAVPVSGQGSSVYNHSACGSGRGGAAVAAPCADASGVYYNPGALALSPSAIGLGFTAINNSGSFVFDETGREVEREGATPVVPHGYLSYRFGSDQRWAGSFGFWAPYGLGIEWPQDFEGRYISHKTQLQGLYLQPTISYQLIPGKLAIGAGPQIVLGGIELNQTLDAPTLTEDLSFLPLETDVATARLDGDGVGFGGAVGVYYRVSERLAFGARYMHSVKVDLEGTADFEALSNPDIFVPITDPESGSLVMVPLDAVVAQQMAAGGPLADQGVDASLEFPPQAVLGVMYAPTATLALMADYQWTGWSTFDEILGEFESDAAEDLVLPLDYKDAHTVRIGTELAATAALDLRGGFIYNTAATPDQTVTPILPEAERQLYSIGLGYDFGALRADAFYNYVNQADRRGRVRGELPGDFTIDDLNIGVYSSTAHLLGLTLTYTFGAR